MEATASIEFEIEPAGPCRKKVKVKIPPERVSEEFNKSYQNWIRSVPISGFRQGKAPRKLVEKRFGEQVAQEVKQSLVDSAFEEALNQNNLAPISDPELDVAELEAKPAEAFAFDFTVTVKPEFELPELKDIEVSVPSAEPTKAEIDAALLSLRKTKATLRPLEKGGAVQGDVVALKVRGYAEDKELFHQENVPYEIGKPYLQGLVAEGLDEELDGKSSGDIVKAKAFAPPHAEGHPLAGMDLQIEAEILDVKRPDVPALDEALARSFDFDSTDELIAQVTKDLRVRKDRERDRAVEELALEELVQKCAFELPEELIQREADELARRAAYELQMSKASEEEIAKRVSEIRARRAEESERELKSFFVLDKIVDKERILVTETEVKEVVAQLAAYNEKTPEQMYAHLREAGRLGSLRNQLRERKAREKLRKKVKVKEAPAADMKTKAAAKKKKTTKKKTK